MRRRLLRNASFVLAAWLTLWGLNRLAEAQQTSIVSGGGGGQMGGGGVSGGTSLFGQQGSAGAGLTNGTGSGGTGYSGGQGGFTGGEGGAATKAPTRGGGAGGTVAIPATSNVFATYYVNPLSLGVMNNGATGKGTFNQPLYAATTTTAGRTIGGTRTGTRTATTTAVVGFTTYGMDRTIPYRTELGDDIPIIRPVASALQAELQDIIQRSERLKSKNSITVSVADGIVFLRGQVATDNERKLAEAMIRLTPAARNVSNELAVAGSVQP